MQYFKTKNWISEKEELKIGKIITHTFLWVFSFIVILDTVGMIGAGERGVLLQFGAVQDNIFNEGIYFKIPFIQQVKKIDVRVQKEETDAPSASKDLQQVSSRIALNFHLNPNKVNKIWQEIGKDFKSRLIDPAIQEAVKASTALFTAEELITKRELVREEIKKLLTKKLQPQGIMIDELNIVNFDFSPVFNTSIEVKVTAEQQALAAKNKLEQVKFEAQQAVEAAQGKAKALQIEGDALRATPQIVELRFLEKWNGIMPLYYGGGKDASIFIGLENK